MNSREILIAEVTPDDSRRLQQLAFKAGYDWSSAKRTVVQFANQPYLAARESDKRAVVQFANQPYLAARESDKRLFQANHRYTPWGADIREVTIQELAALFTKELVLDCTIPEGN